MSMNLNVKALLEADTKLGKKTITERFGLWQTPTSVTYSCLGEGIPTLEKYSDWVRSVSAPYQSPIYAEEDFFSEHDPVDYETIYPAEDHLKELNEWIEDHKGWEIAWFAM